MVFSTAVAQSAAAQEKIKIGTGGPSGVYHTVICPAIAEKVKKHALNSGGKFAVECLTSAGTGENIDKVKSGEFHAGLAQFDVLGYRYSEEKDLDETVVPIGSIAPEAMFCVAAKSGRIKSADQLVDSVPPAKKFVISVGSESSGTALSWQFLMKNDRRLTANVELKFVKDFKHEIEFGRLHSGSRDLVCFMQTPSPDNERIKDVISSPDLQFVAMSRPEWAAYQINNLAAYAIMPAQIKGAMSMAVSAVDTSVSTIHTKSTLILNPDNVKGDMFKVVNDAVRSNDLLPPKSPAGMAAAQARSFFSGVTDRVRSLF